MKSYILVIGILVGVFWTQLYTIGVDVFNEIVSTGEEIGDLAKQDNPVEKVTEQLKEEAANKRKDIGPSEDKTVIMYATSWCRYCEKARSYFKNNNIRYTEYDIERHDQAKRMYDLLGGNGVPLILVNGKKIQGFNAQKFRLAYKQ